MGFFSREKTKDKKRKEHTMIELPPRDKNGKFIPRAKAAKMKK
jgi:hypothetical protein